MQTVLQVGVPPALFLLMFVVGLDLAGEHLRLAVRRRLLVATATVVQAAVIPLIAVAIVRVWSLDVLDAAGLVLIAACPGGGISNSYTYLARADIALSVVLTTVSCLLAVVTMPIVLAAGGRFVAGVEEFTVPTGIIVIQLGIFVLFPVSLGMVVRRIRPAFAERQRRLFERLSLGLIAVLLLLVVGPQTDRFAAELPRTGTAAAALTLGAMLCGWCFCRFVRADQSASQALTIEFAVRNVAIAMIVAVSVYERVEFAIVGGIYFLTQIPILLATTTVFRRRSEFTRR